MVSHQVGEWQRSRQSDRWTGWTWGSSASAPGEMDGWVDGWSEGLEQGQRALGAQREGAISNKTTHLGP